MKKIYITILLLALCRGLTAHAAVLNIIYSSDRTRIDLDVIPDKPLNTLQGSIHLKGNAHLETGASNIPLWLSLPKIKNGDIDFDGVIPGGLQNQTRLFSIISDNNSPISLKVSVFSVYLNDGNGTKDKLDISETAISTSTISTHSDKLPPEEFLPSINQSQDIFDGKKFLVFSTTDKQSGLDHYEIKEGSGEWSRAESPYLLSDQNITNEIQIKAVDRSGNFLIVKVNDRKGDSTNPDIILLAILIILIISTPVYLRWKRHRN